MIGVGAFGKMPSHGDFVSMGMASATGRSFDKFSQMANDMVAQEKGKLPQGPIGFCFRDVEAESLLVGVMVGSKDSAGRAFPMSLFCELPIKKGMNLAGAPGVFTPAIVEVNRLALDIEMMSVEGLRLALPGVPLPNLEGINEAFDQEVARLEEVQLSRVLRRIYAEKPGAATGAATLLKACDNAKREGPRRPVSVNLRATSDVELLFWLVVAQKRLGTEFGGLSVFWDVSSQRAILAPGMPDSNTLNFLARPNVQFSRLWETGTGKISAEADARAAEGLPTELAALLDEPKSAMASDFVVALSPGV